MSLAAGITLTQVLNTCSTSNGVTALHSCTPRISNPPEANAATRLFDFLAELIPQQAGQVVRSSRLLSFQPSDGHFWFGSRLCENVHAQRTRRIVFSLFFFRR